MNPNDHQHRAILQDIAQRAMLAQGLLPDFSPEVLAELGKIQGPATDTGKPVNDLRELLWASIDNDDSRDLDQLTVAEVMPGEKIKILVAVADVDALVGDGSAIDAHARHNTTSVYTAAKIFPMLPERLSTNLTSLNVNEDRLALVVEMVIGADASLLDSDIYRARVRNQAQLAYDSVAAWLEGGSMPEPIATVKGLAENLRVQDKAAQSMKNLRHVLGALSLETIEARPIFEGDTIRDLQVEKTNRAKELIEDFMIAANGVTAPVRPTFTSICLSSVVFCSAGYLNATAHRGLDVGLARRDGDAPLFTGGQIAGIDFGVAVTPVFPGDDRTADGGRRRLLHRSGVLDRRSSRQSRGFSRRARHRRHSARPDQAWLPCHDRPEDWRHRPAWRCGSLLPDGF